MALHLNLWKDKFDYDSPAPTNDELFNQIAK